MQLTELITRHLNVPEARERSTISISFGVSSQIINIQEIHLCSIIHIQLLPKLHKVKKKKKKLFAAKINARFCSSVQAVLV